MKRTLTWVTVILVVVMALLAGCSSKPATNSAISSNGSASKPAEQSITLKIGYTTNDPDPWHKSAVKFGEILKQKSNGRIKVQTYPSSQLGSEREMIEGMKAGTVDMAVTGAGTPTVFEPKFGIIEVLYLYKDQAHLQRVLNGPIGQEISDSFLKSTNVRVLAWWDRGPRHLTTNREIKSPADLKGLKLRVPEVKVDLAMWKAFGASPTPMAFGEVFTSLKQGVIEGQENPLSIINSASFFDVQKYLMLTGHKIAAAPVMISEKTWAKLSDGDKKLVQEAAAEATKYNNDLVAEDEKNLVAKMKEKGMNVVTPDVEAFRKIAQEQWTKLASEGMIPKDMLEKVLASK